MQMRPLGQSEIMVSEICLGTMTFGSQNTQSEASRQIDIALDCGVNFIDTAEMYPTTPRRPETTGRTEELIGNWLGDNAARRDQVVLATKVTGEGNSDIRGGAKVDGKAVRDAFEASLRRLRTDHIDLYQLHWPNRGSYHFRKNWRYNPAKLDFSGVDAEICDMLEEVARLRQEGKLKAFGLSNETAWGVCRFLEIARQNDLPRVVSIQNEYSLLCRHFDLDLAETCHAENVGLLAYSPLAAGLLSGKYTCGAVPPGSRMSMQPNLNGRMTEQSKAAVSAYGEVAKRHGLELAQMALAYALSRSFMTSVIVGATTEDQLRVNLGAADLTLSEDVIEDIESVRRRFPMPF